VVFAAVGVVATIVWNRIVTRRRATIDILLADQTNFELLKVRAEFARHNGSFDPLFDRSTWFTPESFFLISICNRYELVAIGIQEGIVDERLYKKTWRTTLVRDWIRLRSGIISRRNQANHPAMFCEFETLAKRWANASEMPAT